MKYAQLEMYISIAYIYRMTELKLVCIALSNNDLLFVFSDDSIYTPRPGIKGFGSACAQRVPALRRLLSRIISNPPRDSSRYISSQILLNKDGTLTKTFSTGQTYDLKSKDSRARAYLQKYKPVDQPPSETRIYVHR